MVCSVCNGARYLLGDVCPLCGEEEDAVEEHGADETQLANTMFRAEYLTMGLGENKECTYIEVDPPATLRKPNLRKAFDIFVVLDCSYSMEGPRIQRANIALQALYECEEVSSMTVFRFGSSVEEPQAFYKATCLGLPAFQAKCGTTNFIPPLEALEGCLRQRMENIDSTSSQCLALFLSDGECHDNPRWSIQQLGRTLQVLDCPLLSIAITTAVSPDIMVALSDLSGDMPLLLINDDDAEAKLTTQLIEYLPLTGAHEIAHICFSSAQSGDVLETHTRSFLCQGPTMSFVSPKGFAFDEVDISISIVVNGCAEPAEVQIASMCTDVPFSVEESIAQWGKYGRAFLWMAHLIMGAYIKGEVQRDEAEAQVLVLRDAFHAKVGSSQVDDKAWVLAQVGMESSQAKLTQDQRRQAASLIQARRATLTETQQGFNKILDTVGRNDVKSALEAYSRIGVKVKHNRRLKQIAEVNSKKISQHVSERVALNILHSGEPEDDSQREMAACLLWLCNPYEAIDSFESLNQGDWVGRAVLVVPGPVAALNCWRLESALIRPFSITLSLIPQIKVDPADGQRLAVIDGTGYPEFNACLPMIGVGEHVGAVRLALHTMRHSTAGQASLSDICCGSRELFMPPMVNAMYANAVLSSLAKASLEADYEGVVSGLLTCIDLAIWDAPGATPAEYWATVFHKMTGDDALSFIANKEMDAIPDVVRAFFPVLCTDAAYALPEEQMKLLFARLLVRSVLDQTSLKLHLCDAIGIDQKAHLAKCEAYLRNLSEAELDDTQSRDLLHVSPTKGQSINFRLHASKLSLMYALHMSMRRHVTDVCISGFFRGAVDGRLPMTDLIAILKEAQSGIGIEQLVAEIFGKTCDASVVIHDLLIFCCSGHAGAKKDDLPKHDGRYASARLEELAASGMNPAGLSKLAKEVEAKVLADIQQSAFKKVYFDRHKLQIVHCFAHSSMRFLDSHPWEAHRHDMPRLTLGFTTDQRLFSTREDLWNCLQEGWYHKEDLQELLQLSREDIVDFDLEEWKASHRHFLPGFHMYSLKNLAQCRDNCACFVGSMEADMERHYNGTNGAMYRRNFTEKMRAWVAPYARHIWQEAQIAKAVQKVCSEAKHLDEVSKSEREFFVDLVWQMFPELSTLEPWRSQARRKHIGVLVDEACSANGCKTAS